MSIGLSPKLLRNIGRTYITTTVTKRSQHPACFFWVPTRKQCFLLLPAVSLLLTLHVPGVDRFGPALLGAEKLPPQGQGEDSHTRFTAAVTPAQVQHYRAAMERPNVRMDLAYEGRGRAQSTGGRAAAHIIT